VFKFLINNGADINIADNDGETPMSLARRNRAKDVVRLFEPQFHLAFAMVLHVKLGAGSDARFLAEELLKKIIRLS
jgi:ankyrin repeat protein